MRADKSAKAKARKAAAVKKAKRPKRAKKSQRVETAHTGEAQKTANAFEIEGEIQNRTQDDQEALNLHSPRGRLRYADRLRRPRWRNDQP